MEFREAENKDLQAIVDLLHNDTLGAGREKSSDEIDQRYVKAFDLIKQEPNNSVFVAVKDNKVVGTFQLTFIQNLTYSGGIRAQIEGVRVYEELRGTGLGQLMINKAIELAKDKGAHMVQLTTDKKRPEAIKFYEKLGFVSSHEGMKLHLI
ncbi:GNAT family N-acetyltransferase [Fulvivirga lutimaris]|uniref:GNAT family N-acetyltransferase n=1 Tax=Fulvivirga lutimaris TaxID=1819566 RepID=UPI0012BD8085|nr:GNAT family N-acetyltransferase [Fulvivirga lutimaris]MTI39497.1 GNAT family N-acetyltransferase [Fulvivirga lutimaris]